MSSQFPSHPQRETYSLNSERAFVDALGKKWQWNGTKVRWEPFQVYPSNGTYDAESWDGSERAPTKNAVRDKLVLIDSTINALASNSNLAAYIANPTAAILANMPGALTFEVGAPGSVVTFGTEPSAIKISLLGYTGSDAPFLLALEKGYNFGTDISIIENGGFGYDGLGVSYNVLLRNDSLSNVGEVINAINSYTSSYGVELFAELGNNSSPLAIAEEVYYQTLFPITPAAYIGQLCKTPTGWWRWDGEVWAEDITAIEDSPHFSGIPTVATANIGTNTQQIATTEFVKNEILDAVETPLIVSSAATLIGGTPSTGTITFNAAPNNGGTVKIGNTTYYLGGIPYPAGPTDVSNPAFIPGEVATAADWAGALASVINTWNPGVWSNVTDPNVSAIAENGVITLTSKYRGTTTNAITITVTAENVVSSGNTLTGAVGSLATPASSLGQTAIVNEKDVYVCTKLHPVRWELTSPDDLTAASTALTLTEQQQTNVRTNVNIRQLHSKVFTPTSTGWWRIITHPSVIGGVIRVTADDGTKTTDIEVSIHVDKDNRGVMNQTRHSVRGGGHISKFRVARNQNGLVICDVNVTAIPAPNTQLRLEADGILFPGFITPTLITGAILDNETTQVDDLNLGNGLRSSGPIISHLGSGRDPGTSLGIEGRARYLHGLSLTAGNARFTGASDHFHLTFNGASGANAGSRTAQGGSNWSTFQMQNSNASTTNEIFLGGVTAFFYGDTEFGTVTTVDNIITADYRYGISTDAVITSPLEPDFTGQVDLWYTSNIDFPAISSTIMVNFPTGVAGISAAILPAIVLSSAYMAAPDGRLQENGSPLMVYRLRITLYGLNSVEWNPNYKTSFSPSTVWKTTKTPAQILGNKTLTPHPTRRDKVIAEFNQGHNMLLGQVVVLRLTDTSWGVSPNSYSGCITKIINATTFEMKVGIVRQEGGFEIGAREYLTRYDGLQPNVLRIPSHPFVNGEAVKLSVMGTMQTGLSEGTTYYVNKHPGQPNHWIYLHTTPDISNLATRVNVTQNTGRGIYTIYRANPSPALGEQGWTIHKGNRDPVHQQTISDVGWNLHRNVFEGRRDIAAGVIGRAALGGLCDMPREVIGSAAVGFNSSSEADFTYTFGRNLRNTTTNSVEIGTSDSFKLRVTDNAFSVISDNVEVLSVDNDGDTTINGTLTPEWITLENMDGYVIPPNTLAQKAGVLHFGNNIVDTSTKYIAKDTTGQSFGHTTIASFPIPGEYKTEESTLWLDLELSVSKSINTNAYALLVFDYENGATNDGTSGCFIELEPGQSYYKIKGLLRNTVTVVGTDSYIAPSFNGLNSSVGINICTKNTSPLQTPTLTVPFLTEGGHGTSLVNANDNLIVQIITGGNGVPGEVIPVVVVSGTISIFPIDI